MLAQNLEARLNKEYHSSNEFSKSIYGSIAAITPKTSLSNLETIIALSQAALLSEIGYDVDPEVLAKSSIGHNTIRRHLEDAAVDSLFKVVEEIMSDGCK